MATVVILNDQKISATVTPVNSIGEPAPVDGVPSWSVSDPSVVDLVVDESGLSATVLSKSGVTGETEVTVNFDADLGEGVTNITATGTVVVDAAEAVAGSIVFGAAEPRI